MAGIGAGWAQKFSISGITSGLRELLLASPHARHDECGAPRWESYVEGLAPRNSGSLARKLTLYRQGTRTASGMNHARPSA